MGTQIWTIQKRLNRTNSEESENIAKIKTGAKLFFQARSIKNRR